MKRAQALYGYTPRDLPEIRDWLVRELADEGKLWLAMMLTQQAADQIGQFRVPTSPQAERRALEESHLFWVPAAETEIIEHASKTLPSELVMEQETLPYPSGFVVFEKSMVGIPAGPIGRTIAHVSSTRDHIKVDPRPSNFDDRLLVRAMRWGPITLEMEDGSLADGVGLSSWMHTQDFEGDLSGQVSWLPLGRTDWLFGQHWQNYPLCDEPDPIKAVDRDSMIEDRTRFMALWALMNTQTPDLHVTSRTERREAVRRGCTAPSSVHVVRWNPTRYANDHPTTTGRKINVRYHVNSFWRRQPFGPRAENKRRWTFIPDHWRGPVDAPLSPHSETVSTVTR